MPNGYCLMNIQRQKCKRKESSQYQIFDTLSQPQPQSRRVPNNKRRCTDRCTRPLYHVHPPISNIPPFPHPKINRTSNYTPSPQIPTTHMKNAKLDTPVRTASVYCSFSTSWRTCSPLTSSPCASKSSSGGASSDLSFR